MASSRIFSSRVISLLSRQLADVSGPDLLSILRYLPNPYARLTSVGGDKPKVPRTEGVIAILNRLKQLGIVSSFDENASPIKVNKRLK